MAKGKNPWKDKVLDFNRKRAEVDEKAVDMMTLLEALPPGQRKQLLRDEMCGPILRKYGIGDE